MFLDYAYIMSHFQAKAYSRVCHRISIPYQLLKSILSLGAVCGNVFASPNAQQVKRGIDLIDNDIG